MERDTIRRNTVQLQEWAAWRHNQTIAQLQKLKEETSGKVAQECINILSFIKYFV
jgi:hypothetical protein